MEVLETIFELFRVLNYFWSFHLWKRGCDEQVQTARKFVSLFSDFYLFVFVKLDDRSFIRCWDDDFTARMQLDLEYSRGAFVCSLKNFFFLATPEVGLCRKKKWSLCRIRRQVLAAGPSSTWCGSTYFAMNFKWCRWVNDKNVSFFLLFVLFLTTNASTYLMTNLFSVNVSQCNALSPI